tara:strand:+ start:904 stop:1683 length:780 start_codon:yes stop_codon:yes gene_type:complete
MITRQHAYLLTQLVKRDLQARYKGSLLGGVWLIGQPLLLLAVYSLVFGVVFEARGLPTDSAVPFPLFFFAGLIIHQAMAEVLMRTPGLIRSHSSYVTKIVFPLWLLPVMTVATALVSLCLQLLILLAAMLLWHIPIPATVLWLPILLAGYALTLLATAWLVSALGVFLPDLTQIMGLVATALLFLSPVFYTAEHLPEPVRDYAAFNPLVWPIESLRDALYTATLPALLPTLAYLALMAVAAIISLALFRRMRPAFADIL